MKNYCGNARPYIYVLHGKSDKNEADKVASALSLKGHSLWCSSSFSRIESGRLKRASVLLVLISKDFAGSEDLKRAVSQASRDDKPIISVYLEDVALSAGLSMLLGTTQGVIKSNFAKDEEYLEKLCQAPLFSDLKVTAAQKSAVKKTGFAIGFLSLAIVAAVILLALLNPFENVSHIDPDSELARLGLSGNALDYKELYIYGDTLRDEHLFYQLIETKEGDQLILEGSKEKIPSGSIKSVDDFSQLVNLEALCLAGNEISDLSPIEKLKNLKMLDLSGGKSMQKTDLSPLAKLPKLEVLNLAYTYVSDLSPLLSCPSLKRLYLSNNGRWLIDENHTDMGDVEVIFIDSLATDYHSLKAALENENAHSIYVSQSITIPAGGVLKVNKDVFVATHNDLENNGTLIVEGKYKIDNAATLNNGSIIVQNGGELQLSHGRITNYGELTVENEGRINAPDYSLWHKSGYIKNDGEMFIYSDAQLHFDGGRIENNGEILGDGEFYGSPSDIEGDGVFSLTKIFKSVIDPESTLGKLGLSGNVLEYTELYAYGGYLSTEPIIMQWVKDDEGGDRLLDEQGNEIGRGGELVDISEFSALTNLTALSLAGNRITDVSPLANLKQLKYLDLSGNETMNYTDFTPLTLLPELEVLNLAFCYMDTDIISVLKNCPKLKTLYLSYSGEWHTDYIDPGDIQIIYLGAKATDYETLKAACEDESVHNIYIRDSITIPEGETLTIRDDAFATTNNQDNQFIVEGTLIIEGMIQIHYANTVNNGKIEIVGDGCLMVNYDTFTNNGEIFIDENAHLGLTININFHQNGGLLVNNGLITILDESTLYYNGGRIENNGVFSINRGLHGTGHIIGGGNRVYGSGVFVDNGGRYYEEYQIITPKACREKFDIIIE